MLQRRCAASSLRSLSAQERRCGRTAASSTRKLASSIRSNGCEARCHCLEPSDRAQAGHAANMSRQQVLQLAAAVTAQYLLSIGSVRAEEQQAKKLPKAYVLMINRLIKSLRESLEAETSGAPEYEVRRKADPAKEQVREFVGKWRDNPAVSSNSSHDEIKAALLELAGYYQKNGQRSRLSADVRDSVLQHLSAAEAMLPKQEEKVLGIF